MDPIEQNIRNQLTDELVKMVRDDYAEYTDDALRVAKDELRRRGYSEEKQKQAAESSQRNSSAEQTAGDSSYTIQQLRTDTLGRNALLDLLLRNELEYVETYEAISDFVGSMNIRCGEYQGGVAVIKKMDLDNFILFVEDTDDSNARRLIGCVAVGKSELTDRMDEIAREKGYAEVEQSPFEGYPF